MTKKQSGKGKNKKIINNPRANLWSQRKRQTFWKILSQKLNKHIKHTQPVNLDFHFLNILLGLGCNLLLTVFTFVFKCDWHAIFLCQTVLVCLWVLVTAVQVSNQFRSTFSFIVFRKILFKLGLYSSTSGTYLFVP